MVYSLIHSLSPTYHCYFTPKDLEGTPETLRSAIEYWGKEIFQCTFSVGEKKYSALEYAVSIADVASFEKLVTLGAELNGETFYFFLGHLKEVTPESTRMLQSFLEKLSIEDIELARKPFLLEALRTLGSRGRFDKDFFNMLFSRVGVDDEMVPFDAYLQALRTSPPMRQERDLTSEAWFLQTVREYVQERHGISWTLDEFKREIPTLLAFIAENAVKLEHPDAGKSPPPSEGACAEYRAVARAKRFSLCKELAPLLPHFQSYFETLVPNRAFRECFDEATATLLHEILKDQGYDFVAKKLQ